MTGHYLASTDVARSALTINGKENITWFKSSEKVQRGFCAKCGSTLFWDPIFQDWTSIAMGAFDGETQTTLGKHIFVSEKGDYYNIADGLPQNHN